MVALYRTLEAEDDTILVNLREVSGTSYREILALVPATARHEVTVLGMQTPVRAGACFLTRSCARAGFRMQKCRQAQQHEKYTYRMNHSSTFPTSPNRSSSFRNTIATRHPVSARKNTMRTKKTGKSAPAANGKAKPSTPATPGANGVKPSSQPPEISEADRAKMRMWLDKQERPFSVVMVPSSRKRKRDTTALPTQDDIFEARLSIQYEVKPKERWDNLRRYKKFTGGFTMDIVARCCCPLR